MVRPSDAMGLYIFLEIKNYPLSSTPISQRWEVLCSMCSRLRQGLQCWGCQPTNGYWLDALGRGKCHIVLSQKVCLEPREQQQILRQLLLSCDSHKQFSLWVQRHKQLRMRSKRSLCKAGEARGSLTADSIDPTYSNDALQCLGWS